jgi:hypothetical protein
MKNKIAVNAKYYKASQVDGLQGHVMRLFAEDKNVHKHLSENNYGSSDSSIKNNYKKAFENVKNLKKNSNTLIDAVFVFPFEQWQKSTENGMGKKEVSAAIRQTMIDIQNKTGLTPVGYKMHLDEGKINDAGEVELNPHAHMQFANICHKDVTLIVTKNITMKDRNNKAIRDPVKPKKWLYERDSEGNVRTEQHNIKLKHKMPLQYLRGRGSDSVWSEMQDIAAKNLAEFGFERGISKEITNARHRDRQKMIADETVNAEKNLNKIKDESREKMKNIQSFYIKILKWAKAAISGDIATLEAESLSIIELFYRGIPNENKPSARDFFNEKVESISDSTVPVADIFAKTINKDMNEKMADIEGENNQIQPSSRRPIGFGM